MNKCPRCGSWTLQFDEYFGRYRCFDSECGWMVRSSADREIRKLRSKVRPTKLYSANVLGNECVSSYDEQDDALLFDYGADEPAFDLPESDGRTIWKIGRRTRLVVGFVIFYTEQCDLPDMYRSLSERKGEIEAILRNTPSPVQGGRVTRLLVDNLEGCVGIHTQADETHGSKSADEPFECVIKKAMEMLVKLKQGGESCVS